jgi:phenylalanine-4-hydroxylase
MEDNKTVAYGAGIISSTAELKYALSPKSKKILMDTPLSPIYETLYWIAKKDSYITDGFQDEYYVLNDWSQLDQIIAWLWIKYGRL